MSAPRHHFLFLPALAIGLLMQPAQGWAQANEAPVAAPFLPDLPVYGSATGPVINPWSTYFFGSCTGMDCLSDAEKAELNELCKLAGAQWRSYALCEKLAASLLAPQP